MLTYEITEKDHCRTLESYLLNLLPGAPISYLTKLARSGHAALNGAKTDTSVMLRIGDRVTLKESSRTLELIASGPPLLDILYEDSWIIAINKPAGMAMHRAAEVDDQNLVDLANLTLADKGEGGKFRPVNRLDRGTSGAVLLARTSHAAGMFGRLVKEEGLGKLYLALVAGKMPLEGIIDSPLAGKEAVTSYRSLYQHKGKALVAVWPLTGRMHQIRQHFKAIGHSILGDKRYGGPDLPDYSGFALHSFRTILQHPDTGERLDLCAPLPEAFIALLRELSGEHCKTLILSLADLPEEYTL